MGALHVVRHGDGPATPLVIAHGLFGSARNWGVVAKRLADRGPVVVPDMRNHGESFWDDDHSYRALAGDLAGLIEGRADVLGHSMGGKAAMALALTRPDKVRRLVVVDIAPVAYAHSQMPYLRAMQAADLSGATRRSEVALDVDDPGIAAFLLQSVDVTEKRWRLNLDVLADEMDGITGFPEGLGSFDGPALFLAGANSDYLTGHEDAIRTHFPKAEVAQIDGAGHWPHAEKPREVEAAVRAFLDA